LEPFNFQLRLGYRPEMDLIVNLSGTLAATFILIR